MIITGMWKIPSSDSTQYAWAGLRRFQHIPFVERQIVALHDVPESQRRNARKQATQIKYCLIQAKEYFDAAASVSLATKPVLLYYSIMSLALAEILLKQDGLSSLDKAREKNHHHGLTFHVASLSKADSEQLQPAATALVAKPTTTPNGDFTGTFELWHRTCREMPVSGMVEQRFQTGTSSSGDRVIFVAPDAELDRIPESGLSFCDCICHIPGMREFAQSHGLASQIVRARGSLTIIEGDNPSNVYQLSVHPERDEVLNKFYENIFFSADAINRLIILEAASGLILQWQEDTISGKFVLQLPHATMWTAQEVRFWPKVQALNEFGYLYVALFLAGNYARYFPDLSCGCSTWRQTLRLRLR